MKNKLSDWLVTLLWCLSIAGLWLLGVLGRGLNESLGQEFTRRYLSVPVVVVLEDGVSSDAPEKIQMVLREDSWIVEMEWVAANSLIDEVSKEHENSENFETLLGKILPPLCQVIVRISPESKKQSSVADLIPSLVLKINDWEELPDVREVRWSPEIVERQILQYDHWMRTFKKWFQIGIWIWTLLLVCMSGVWWSYPYPGLQTSRKEWIFLAAISIIMICCIFVLLDYVLIVWLFDFEEGHRIIFHLFSILIYAALAWWIKFRFVESGS